MRTNALFSILALYNYDPTIFENLKLPAGVDKGQAVSTILLRNAELEILYTNPDIMKEAIGIWSAGRLKTWEKMYATLTVKYNPIWNKDGVITEDETTSGSLNHSGSASGTDEHSVSGYNSSGYVPADKTDTDTSNKYDDRSSGTRHYERKEQGNIGITTTQQMIKEEREIADFDIYQYISDDFMQRFTVMVW